MSDPVSIALKRIHEALALLTCDSGDCCGLDLQPCRTAVYLGGEVPWDTCDSGCGSSKNGMLWGKLVGINPVTGQDQGGRCNSYKWSAEIGVIRCITGMDNAGNPPSAKAIEADSARQAKDAGQIFSALTCCATRPDWLRDVNVTSWAPLGPSGNCAGGAWNLTGVLDVCC